MYADLTTTDIYPKTLLIRNEVGGWIWQVYHVQKLSEARKLAVNATRNGFYGITLEDHQPEYKETFPLWRETEGGKEIILTS